MKKQIDEFFRINQKNSKLIKIILFFLVLYLGKNLLHFIIFEPGIFIKIPIFIISIMLHEIAHGYAALFSGDKTALYRGRLSFNPLNHIDPLGFFLPLLLILMGSNFIIGWAKPVPVNYSNLKNGRIGEFLVSIAGVLTNFSLAILGVFLLKFFPHTGISSYIVYLVSFNVMIGVFNLLPIPPLDGSKLLASLLPEGVFRNFIFYDNRIGFIIIFALSYLGLLNNIIFPLYLFFINLLEKL